MPEIAHQSGRRLLALMAALLLAPPVGAETAQGQKAALQQQNAAVPGPFRLDPPTLHSIGLRWYLDGDDNGNATCTVHYRPAGDGPWQEALPLLRINRETVDRDFEHYGANSGIYTVGNLLAGSILFLKADTEYEIRLALNDPDGGTAQRRERIRTRAVPRAPAPRRTLNLYPPEFTGERRAPAYTDLPQALAALAAGDLLLVHPGEHRGGASLATSGTATAPIVIRGAGPGALISVDQSSSFNLNLNGRQHVFVEDLELRGGRVGIIAQSTHHLVVRRCTIWQVRFGLINTQQNSSNWYIADNTITGTDANWVPRQQDDAAETGVNLYGRGHVVEYNRISRFWDCLAIADFGRPPGGVGAIDQHCVAIDFNNNDLFYARDDLLETDFGSHNIRVFDNRLYNGHVGCSTQPLYGGPAYFVGNVIYGVDNTPYKLHNWPAGILIFNNTSVASGSAFRSAPIWQNATLRNNLLLGAADDYTMETGSPDPRTSLDYNGWNRISDDPGRFIKFTDDGTLSGASSFRFASLEAYFAATGNGRHSVLIDEQVFVDAPYPKPGATYQPGAADLRLRPDSAPVDAGVHIPNITRTTTGPAPDMGAYEFGLPLPHYGPRPQPASTVVEQYAAARPRRLELRQNTPNPFNGQALIRFALPADGPVDLVVYNLSGQKVTTLVAGHRKAGAYTVRWDGRDGEKRPLASGSYLYVLRSGGQIEKRKMALVR